MPICGSETYTLYRMTRTFGDYNPALTRAIKRVAQNSANVKVLPHAFDEMENDGFDLEDVFTCLRRGKAHGPEFEGGEYRTNVIHRGLQIRVVVGLRNDGASWDLLATAKVVTVMRSE